MDPITSYFFPMFAGHLVADFWLQSTSWQFNKNGKAWKSEKLILHALVASVLPVLFTLELKLWWLGLVIFATHYLIDVIKSRLNQNLWVFLGDQLLHTAVIWGLTAFFVKDSIPEDFMQFWIYATCFILVTTPFAFLVGIFLAQVIKITHNPYVISVSAWIGILERILIIIFVLAGETQAVGFLIAAKSVFWYKGNDGKETLKPDFYLVGTLMSFTLAIIIGFVLKELLRS